MLVMILKSRKLTHTLITVSLLSMSLFANAQNLSKVNRIGKLKFIKGNSPELYVTIGGRNRMSDFND
jgi:hypothetical protein